MYERNIIILDTSFDLFEVLKCTTHVCLKIIECKNAVIFADRKFSALLNIDFKR